jgi:hypothetical protein
MGDSAPKGIVPPDSPSMTKALSRELYPCCNKAFRHPFSRDLPVIFSLLQGTVLCRGLLSHNALAPTEPIKGLLVLDYELT